MAVAFVDWWNGGERIEGSIAAGAIPADKEKPFVAAVEELGNIQRTADVCAKVRLIVLRLGDGKTAEREWGGVEGRVVVGEIKHAVGLIYVEPAASHAANHDWATPHSSALSAGTTTKAAEAFPLHAVAKFLNAILKILLAAAAEILGAALRATDADGFGGASGACAVHRQKRDSTKAFRSPGPPVAAEPRA